jgi:hypothetical protein
LFADGALVGTAAAAPYSFYWNTSSLVDGSQHVLTAVARDQAGNTTNVSTTATVKAGFDLTPPQLAFASPANGERVHGNATISINAKDNQAVTRVEFYADNKLVTSWSAAPYTIKWATNKLAKGAHTLMSVAYDAAGNSGQTTISIIK